jgi:Rrf2 family protein
MLALTKKTGYGLVAMGHLAGLRDGEVASATQIARLFGVPRALLMNVLKELAAAGFVESVRGASGGYRLARRPEEILLADLTAAVERPVQLAECSTQAASSGPCTKEQMARCPVVDPVHRFHRRLSDFLRTMTLAEILGPGLHTVRRHAATAPRPAPRAGKWHGRLAHASRGHPGRAMAVRSRAEAPL